MPALRRIDPLPTHELAIRLFYLYDHFRREPVVDSFPDHPQVNKSCYIQTTATCGLAAAQRGRRGGGQTKGTCAESSRTMILMCILAYCLWLVTARILGGCLQSHCSME